MSQDQHLRPGAVVVDRYRLERHLGQGGMGSVWLAHHLGLDIPCAVKFLRSDAATSVDLRARFEREAKAAARLKSPHVVQTLDHGVWQNTPYIAMELLEGEDLNRRLRRVHHLDARDTVRIVTQVAHALTKAHAAGLVHRDLKPSNIFLVRDDDQEIAKVLDFGVAKQTVTAESTIEQETRSGSLLGTPHYMSPEQAQGTRVIDHRSDLWSLAVVVYQCMTGQLPFHSEALGDLLVQIIVQSPPVPSHVAPVPPSFDAWWGQAVAREPDYRFQSARELAHALALSLGVPSAVESTTTTGASFSVPPAVAAAFDPRLGAGEALPTPRSYSSLPGPISGAVARGVGMHSSVPTANLVAQSVSIAQTPRRSRAGVVLLATVAGIVIGGVVALLAPSGKSAEDAIAAASASASVAPPPAGHEITPTPTPASSAEAPEPVPSASASAATSAAALPSARQNPWRPSATPTPPKYRNNDGQRW